MNEIEKPYKCEVGDVIPTKVGPLTIVEIWIGFSGDTWVEYSGVIPAGLPHAGETINEAHTWTCFLESYF